MKRFRNVLVYAPVASDDALEPAIARAGELALRTGARITLADVLEPLSPWVERRLRSLAADPMAVFGADRLRRLRAAAQPLRARGIEVTARVLRGAPTAALLEAARADGHDLIMKTARGEAFGPFAFGSVAQDLMRAAQVPVWVVGREQAGPYRRILAAVAATEGDDTRQALSERVLDLAWAMASADGAELHVVHAWTAFGEALLARRGGPSETRYYRNLSRGTAWRALEGTLATLGRRPSHPQVHFRKGVPEEVIRQVHGEIGADLLVMGTVGRSGLSGMVMGNTAEKVLQVVPGSLLAVKPLSAAAEAAGEGDERAVG